MQALMLSFALWVILLLQCSSSVAEMSCKPLLKHEICNLTSSLCVFGSLFFLFIGVQACLQSRVREQEEKYEIQGGPQRGRLNREQLVSFIARGRLSQ